MNYVDSFQIVLRASICHLKECGVVFFQVKMLYFRFLLLLLGVASSDFNFSQNQTHPYRTEILNYSKLKRMNYSLKACNVLIEDGITGISS